MSVRQLKQSRRRIINALTDELFGHAGQLRVDVIESLAKAQSHAKDMNYLAAREELMNVVKVLQLEGEYSDTVIYVTRPLEIGA